MSTLIAFITADPTLDAPAIPPTWDRQVESNRWTTVFPLGRGAPSFSARLMARAAGNPTRALFVCVGPAPMLTRLAAAIAADALPWTKTWATLVALRADAGAIATAIKAAWPDERQHTWTGTPPGALVDGGPIGTLVALLGRIAGADAEDAET